MYSESMPLVEKEWGGRPLDLDARSDQRIGKRPMKPSIRSPLPSGLKDDHVASDRPSIGRRIFRTLTRYYPSRRRSRQPWLQLPRTRRSSLSPWRPISMSCGAA